MAVSLFCVLEKKMFKYFGVLILILAAGNAHSHGDDSKYSRAIIDPLRVHHAHIEDELKLNFSRINNFDGTKKCV